MGDNIRSRAENYAAHLQSSFNTGISGVQAPQTQEFFKASGLSQDQMNQTRTQALDYFKAEGINETAVTTMINSHPGEMGGMFKYIHANQGDLSSTNYDGKRIEHVAQRVGAANMLSLLAEKNAGAARGYKGKS
jgi:hypothetical protein